MKGKRVFYSELAFVVGITILALGTALMERGDFGLSMVVAPAYLIHLKVAQYLPFYTFGMSEYVFQGFLLVLLAVVMRKLKLSYLLSLVTAVIYGFALDGMMWLVGLLPFEGLIWQFVYFASGFLIGSTGIAFLFNTYFPPEAYELLVKEISKKSSASIGKIKTIYDCCSCALAIILSLCFFGTFVGVKWGTVVCAVCNGWLIGKMSSWLEKHFEFKDALPLRKKLS